MAHLSRLAEDLIIYSSPGFGFVELADAYTTGSSLMPQKKNPDSLELIRGKAARVLGKTDGRAGARERAAARLRPRPAGGQGRAVRRRGHDARFAGIGARVVRTLRVRPERMKAATAQGFLTATDLADELVRRGVPFAEAHEQVGKLVKACVEKGITFDEISDVEARRVFPAWSPALRTVATSPERALARKNVVGGTAPGRLPGRFAPRSARREAQTQSSDHAARRFRKESKKSAPRLPA